MGVKGVQEKGCMGLYTVFTGLHVFYKGLGFGVQGVV